MHGRLALLLSSLVACVGTIEGGENTTGLTPEQLAAQAAFTEKAVPHLNGYCVSCHAGSRGATIAFLVGDDDGAMRESLLAFAPSVVNLDAPSSSRVLTKGTHDGPAFTGPQLTDVLEWIRAERIAAGSTVEEQILETDAILPQLCTGGTPGEPTCPINTIPLDSIGAPGASISFVASPTDSALYLQRLSLTPGPSGAYIEHPLLVSFPEGAEPIPDTLDRFFNVKMNLMAGAAPEMISGGAAVFVGLSSLAKVRFHFKSVNVFQTEEPGPGEPGGPGAAGCKDLESFKVNARGPLQTNCASCHANPQNNASSALSLVGIDSADDAVVKTACDQTRLRSNLQDFNSSGIYAAPAPTNTNHPFRFADIGALDAFKAPVNLWLTAERDAP